MFCNKTAAFVFLSLVEELIIKNSWFILWSHALRGNWCFSVMNRAYSVVFKKSDHVSLLRTCDAKPGLSVFVKVRWSLCIHDGLNSPLFLVNLQHLYRKRGTPLSSKLQNIVVLPANCSRVRVWMRFSNRQLSKITDIRLYTTFILYPVQFLSEHLLFPNTLDEFVPHSLFVELLNWQVLSL